MEKKTFTKGKKAFNIDHIDVNKILVSKEEPYVSNKSNISLDIMVIMTLDLYG